MALYSRNPGYECYKLGIAYTNLSCEVVIEDYSLTRRVSLATEDPRMTKVHQLKISGVVCPNPELPEIQQHARALKREGPGTKVVSTHYMLIELP